MPERSPDENLWRRRRIFYRTALIIPAAVIALYFGPNLIMFEKLTRPAPADFIPVIQQRYIPIILALQQYEQIHGRLPQSDGAVKMDFVPSPIRSPGWFDPADRIVRFYSLYDSLVEYHLDGPDPHWQISGPFVHGQPDLPAVTKSSSQTSTIISP